MSSFTSRVTTRYEEITEKSLIKEPMQKSTRSLTLEITKDVYSVGQTQEPTYRRKNIKTRVILPDE